MTEVDPTGDQSDALEALVVGESLIDIVENQRGAVVEHVGGSPANIALGLGRLGRRVELLTWIARDAHGSLIAEHLSASHVEVHPASWGAPSTSTAHAHLRADGSADYNFDVTWSLPANTTLPDARALHIGSIAAFLDPGASTVRQFAHEARDASWLITFDPNIRPALIGNRQAAVRRFEDLASMSTVVKLSDEDAAWLYPGLSIKDTIDAVLALGPAAAFITQGSEGVTLGSGSFRASVAAVRVTAVDTIGAGDTFMASLIDSLLRAPDAVISGDHLLALADRAVRAAAITVGRAGADLPRWDELPPWDEPDGPEVGTKS